MTQCLQQLATGYRVRMTCVDIQRKPSIDLAKSKAPQTARTNQSQGVRRDTAIATVLILQSAVG